MRSLARLFWVLALGGALGGLWAPGAGWTRAHRAERRGPVVVELFTAQGCASCKQANRLIAGMADRPGLIVLTWPVDYWDYLGWKDTFAKPEFATRQRSYARHVGPRDVYTPQVVVDGAAQVSGDDAAAVETLTRAGDHAPRPRLVLKAIGPGRVSIRHAPRTAAVPRGADVWLVRFDPRERDVEVKAGDNRGATVVHRNVVRELVRLGAWRGRAVVFRLPAATETDLASVVLVQGAHGGPIYGAVESKAATGQ